jgi:hypothetical protein
MYESYAIGPFSKFYILTTYTRQYQRDGRLNSWGGMLMIHYS